MARTIAVTGKGGVGKTTVAALIVRWLKENTPGPILALDADPDCNLAALLGLKVDATIGDLREEVQREIKDFPPGMSKENYVQAGLHQLIVESEKVDLITMGRGEGPGCYCYINNLLRKFADDLLPSYRWLVMDNEAGMEHLSRRTTSKVDHLIVVVNENPLSGDCARRIDDLLKGLDRDIRHRYILLNAVREERVGAVRERLAGVSMPVLGCIPPDPAVEEAMFRGDPVSSLNGGPAVTELNQIMARITGED